MSASCGSCGTLQEFGESPAEDYVGRYSTTHDCVEYPENAPRICLAYEMASSSSAAQRQLSAETADTASCDSLTAQIEAGDCSADDIAEITIIDSCVQHEETNRMLADKWVDNMVNHGGAQDALRAEVQASIRHGQR